MQANVMVMAKVGRSSSGIIVSCYYSILSSYSAILNPLYTNMSTWNINVECIFIFKAWIEDSFAILKISMPVISNSKYMKLTFFAKCNLILQSCDPQVCVK